MNERIRELAEQAYEQKPLMVVNPQTYELEHKIGNGGVPMYHKVFNQEKFAELIVRECAELADNQEDYFTAKIIKRHFGVES
jgi:hypothetical protein